jgi:F0F1-type ATP synthase beta subunit
MHCDMLRTRLLIAFVAVAATAALPAGAAARHNSLIKGEEVGYFGGATVTHTVDVFVYSNVGPAAGNHVTVCLAGRCERARGHNASLAWYSASFRTRGYRMGDQVTFTVMASDGAQHARVRVTWSLLCMHNNGSTPQT